MLLTSKAQSCALQGKKYFNEKGEKMAKIKFLPIDGLLEMKANNEKFKLVEVLREESFKEGHVPGAISIPLDQLGEKAKNLLKKSDKVIVYCASYGCKASTKATEMLMKMGYKKTMDFKGGKKQWVDSGLELEK